MTGPLPPAQVAGFQKAMNAARGAGAWKHRVIVLPPGRVTPAPAGPLDAVSDLCLTPPEGDR